MKTSKAKYTEIEIGPHFLTFYIVSHDLPNMVKDGEELYKLLPIELQQINPTRLEHKANDPNIYHPYGSPNNFKEWFRHFHIRFGRVVSHKDIDFILNLDFLNLYDDYIITNLDDNRLDKYKDLVYPSIKGTYEEYLDMLRTGEWRKLRNRHKHRR